jgi:hypothetical protein
MWYTAKTRATKLGVPFEITPKDIRAVWPENNVCPVLRIQMEHNFDKQNGCCSKLSPTLDRIKPELGYVKGNIVVMSLRANQIKNDETDPQVLHQVADWLEGVI